MPLEDSAASRKLVLETTRPDVRLVVLRGSDVPDLVRHGAADGVWWGGYATREWRRGSVRATRSGDCPLPSDDRRVWRGIDRCERRVRVATKFVNVARRFYAGAGMQADIIKLYGAMELAPLLDLRT